MVRGNNPNNVYNFYRDTLSPLLCDKDRHGLITWLMNAKLLADELQCSSCSRSMTFIRRKAMLDQYCWYCSQCRKEKSVRTKSIFSQFPRVPLNNLMFFMWEWCRQPLSSSVAELHGLTSKRTASKLSMLLKDVCVAVMDQQPTIRVGGNGVAVQVDESLFRRRKYNRGRMVTQRWVFGILAMEFNPARPIFHVVKNRSRAVLERVIAKHCRPGTVINSDEWRAYANLSNIGFVHNTVNHSRNFVNPATGCHTNDVECAWRWAKQYMRSYKVSTDVKLHEYLQCYMWRCWRGAVNPRGHFHQFLLDVACIYPL